MARKIPVISFVGYSGSGKTTFIEKLIPELKSRKLRVAVVEHDSAEDMENLQEGNTQRFSQAGADLVSVTSKNKIAWIEKREVEPSLEELLGYIRDVDLIIMEGYKGGDFPKIGVYRKTEGMELVLPIEELTAAVADVPIDEELPCFSLDDVGGVAQYVISHFLQKAGYPEGIALEEGIAQLLAVPSWPVFEYISIDESDGRICGEDINADENIPHFAKSPLDGYALRSEDIIHASQDTPVILKITEEIPAGRQPIYKLESGMAAKILTGGPIPEGADVVIRFEDTVFDAETVALSFPAAPNTNIVPPGEDIHIGEEIIQKGSLINPSVIGLLASLGRTRVLVAKKPVIAIVNTGDELIEAYEPLAPAKIRNSSRYTLSAFLREAGAEVVQGGIAKDSVVEIAELYRKALGESDMVISTGGVSVGDYDLVIPALESLGAQILFWKINIKPGAALVAAQLNGKVILALSGNPTSAAIALQLLGMPYIHKLMGKKQIGLKKIKVFMKNSYDKPCPNGRYLEGRMVFEDGKTCFETISKQKNGAISSLMGCDLIGEVVPGTVGLYPGDAIEAYLINS
ncbi:molybdopterin-guanine dinucleotide biosynthesis protein B [Parasporobacterium paucivorans]|uniref:Molybdopterin molybdenumtransferase n=1 Tax=Parasporobacterium paucivorans DSM 15970 TaxID=1122934 RepID=A0A1M6AAL5_9FIRM|nr:gephyrin-like molybdotransferase Glp [Parasporobacterium paucivorans]SHI33499.1 molybdopterin molybdotransferase [Parasporobacterium paucivorans DSM 15970]